SKAKDFHDEAARIVGFQVEGPPPPKEARVLFEPFVGVGPRRFFDLFSARFGSGYPLTRKDDETGKKVPFALKGGRLRLQMLPHSYLDVEAEAATSFQAAIKK